MNELLTPIEVLWSQLSADVQEVCLALCADAFEEEAVLAIADDPAKFFSELNSRGLIEKLTKKELYQDKANRISSDRVAQGSSLMGFNPPLSEQERSALSALDILDKYKAHPEQFPNMEKQKLRFVADFEIFLQKLWSEEE